MVVVRTRAGQSRVSALLARRRSRHEPARNWHPRRAIHRRPQIAGPSRIPATSTCSWARPARKPLQRAAIGQSFVSRSVYGTVKWPMIDANVPRHASTAHLTAPAEFDIDGNGIEHPMAKMIWGLERHSRAGTKEANARPRSSSYVKELKHAPAGIAAGGWRTLM
jgi:hypothetical protein